jgi:hypothetical protein
MFELYGNPRLAILKQWERTTCRTATCCWSHWGSVGRRCQSNLVANGSFRDGKLQITNPASSPILPANIPGQQF